MLDCEVKQVRNNIRYRLLIINNEKYLLDMGQSFLKILFPFTFWILPNTVYRIENEKDLTLTKTPAVKQTKTSYSSFGAGISLMLANLLGPLMDYFNIHTSVLVNSIILFLVILAAVFFRFYLSGKNKKKLEHIVNVKRLQKDKLWIWPKSLKFIFIYLLSYVFFSAFILVGFWVFIEIGNVMMLTFSLIFLLLSFLASGMSIKDGKAKVKFTKHLKAS
ncbi:DUF443 family protein [Virgibacillus sp. 179-BFC.A HS]|uniref:DUF443 family protein n=1 Tax=Tigheibacillus jepli TaxID=3035914 RepID=A0ABU5CLC2_9BACI|nr:DUF443 family protein [Virgibacillus sp. 179-BFC.A HS]MDY0406298.1 DUF443 family protein [Virgibacillus sp. 179-BFC.A HS]